MPIRPHPETSRLRRRSGGRAGSLASRDQAAAVIRTRRKRPAGVTPADRSYLWLDASHRDLGPRLGSFLREVLADAVGLRTLRPREDDDAGQTEGDHLVIADEGGGGFLPGEVWLIHRDLVDVVAPRPAGRHVVDRIVPIGSVDQDHVGMRFAELVQRLGDQRFVFDLRRAHDGETVAFRR